MKFGDAIAINSLRGVWAMFIRATCRDWIKRNGKPMSANELQDWEAKGIVVSCIIRQIPSTEILNAERPRDLELLMSLDEILAFTMENLRK